MRGKDPNPSFSRQLNKSTRRVLALTIDYDNGERQTLEFLEGSWAIHRVHGNETLDENDHVALLYDIHEITWIENHWKKE